MPPFPKPRFNYSTTWPRVSGPARPPAAEAGRGSPRRRRDRLLLATWNIANLGVQGRRDPTTAAGRDRELVRPRRGSGGERQPAGSGRSTRSSRLATACSSPTPRETRSGRRSSTTRGRCSRSKSLAGCRSLPCTSPHQADGPSTRSSALTAIRTSPRSGPATSAPCSLNVDLLFGATDPAPNRPARVRDVRRRALGRPRARESSYVHRTSSRSATSTSRAETATRLPTPSRAAASSSRSTRRGSARRSRRTQLLRPDRLLPRRDATGSPGARNVFDFDGALFPALWQPRPGSPFQSYVRYFLSTIGRSGPSSTPLRPPLHWAPAGSISSVWLERRSDKAEVRGSNPRSPIAHRTRLRNIAADKTGRKDVSVLRR